MPFSHHSHSGQFCRHASGTLAEMVDSAISRGFKTYGLSEHCPRYRKEDLYPEEEDLEPADLMTIFHSYLSTAHALRAEHASRISLLVGLETESITALDLSSLETLLTSSPHPVEYLVGSVHHAFCVPIDFDLPNFQNALAKAGGWAPLLEEYYTRLLELVKAFEPEVIGHIDLIRLYEPEVKLQEFGKACEILEEVVKYGVGYGALFEFNAAAIRKGWSTPYPASDVLSLILSHGGRMTLSDDAHTPPNVGLNYARTHDYLRKQGVQELWYLKRCEPGTPGVGKRGRTVAKKVEGVWWEDEFWRGCLEGWGKPAKK